MKSRPIGDTLSGSLRVWFENLNSKQQRQSLFSLLLEIESRLRAEARVDFLVTEQHKLGEAKNHRRPVVENLSRYIE